MKRASKITGTSGTVSLFSFLPQETAGIWAGYRLSAAAAGGTMQVGPDSGTNLITLKCIATGASAIDFGGSVYIPTHEAFGDGRSFYYIKDSGLTVNEFKVYAYTYWPNPGAPA